MNSENDFLNLENEQDFAENCLATFLDNNSSMQQYFVASGAYDDDDGDRYDGTQWYNR
jgi:hypothetical protein